MARVAAAPAVPRRRQRAGVASRVCAALFGGYFLAHGATAFLTGALPFARVDRVIAASLLAFAVWCAAAIYVFAARSAWRAWGTLLLLGGALLAVPMLFPGWASRP
ncbi:MAG TPA: DUF3649 domain-containing protein [Pseudoxanthomonas sp.]|nr:DUF3649 domain-containing protein [Pseudoxanthomonas sp.]